MATTLGKIDEEAKGLDDVVPYSMHVSSKYLELTKRKLELTRLPREVALADGRSWALGTPKSVLETILDFWLEHYDWRAQEAHFNTTLPQFRTTIPLPSTALSPDPSAPQSLRIHFVHKRSKHPNAVPLLFCHSWPSSFLEAEKITSALTDPEEVIGYGAGAQMAFHVVVPSIPGFGFSDAAGSEHFGVEDTARVFDTVMTRLGYERYVAHGTGWGFNICRAVALNHSERCAAIHTVNPSFQKPSFKQNPMVFLKYQLARLTKAKISPLSFGYVPSELQAPGEIERENSRNLHNRAEHNGPAIARLYSHRPQTLAFSLCDSPVGLLAGLLDVIHTRSTPQSPIASRSRSPFLSPSELELQESENESPMQNDGLGSAARHPELPPSRRQTDTNASHYTWSSTEVLNWTMLQWLPGPEGGLRWLRQAHLDSSPTSRLSTTYCSVPLGTSSFRGCNSDGHSPIMWGSASNQIAWVKRHRQCAAVPAWEAADMLVLDMRECFGSLLQPHHDAPNLPTRAT